MDSLKYSTYLGGTGFGSDTGLSIAIDGFGIAYITGATESSDFPVTSNAYQMTRTSGSRGFVAKIDPTKSGSDSLVYSTYFGDANSGVAVSDSANVYVTGQTFSSSFPVKNALQPTCGSCNFSLGGDAFVAKLDTTQSGEASLVWSTFLGGNKRDGASGVALDNAGNAYVVGTTSSTDFPTTANAPQGSLADAEGLFLSGDFFVARIKGDGSKLLYSTYLGGTSSDFGFGIAVDGSRNAYVIGQTNSDDVPITPGAFQSFTRGNWDIYVAKLSLDPDFSFSPVAPIAADVGGSGSSSVAVNSLDDFNDNIALSVPPSGFTTLFGTNPVTPPANDSASSLLSLNVGPSVTPGSYMLTVTGISGSLAHTVPVNVTVRATAGGVTQVIGTDQALGCIDNSGISNALTSKLAAAQQLINAGKIQEAINTLTALLHQLEAQAGKHIGTCIDPVTGQPFDADAALIADVKALLASLGENLKPNPVMGMVTNSSGLGISGAAITVLNSTKTVIASTTADSTGFYFFAKTSVFATGTKYTVKVTLAKPYKSSTPASQTLSWNSTMVTLGNFVLN